MQELLHGYAALSIYFAVAATTVLTARLLIKIPNELFRKMLHFVLLGSVFVFVFAFETWWVSAFAAILFEIIVYPLLMVGEKIKNYSAITTERKKGELKASLILVFTMFAVVIAVCWGLLNDKLLVVASILAWGVGDAFAALVGKKYGKHKFHGKLVDGKKSHEGTLAMFFTSFVSVFLVLLVHGNLSLSAQLIISIVAAAAAAAAELFSKGGMDTVICPLTAMVVIDTLMYVFGGIK